jgi:hypothetical protein
MTPVCVDTDPGDLEDLGDLGAAAGRHRVSCKILVRPGARVITTSASAAGALAGVP